jgi:hypothetical protein
MAEENENLEEEQQPEDGQILVGFHQLGGVRIVAEDVRLEPNEAFILAGQIIAHATLAINQSYMEAAMARRMMQGGGPDNGTGGLILPPGLK